MTVDPEDDTGRGGLRELEGGVRRRTSRRRRSTSCSAAARPRCAAAGSCLARRDRRRVHRGHRGRFRRGPDDRPARVRPRARRQRATLPWRPRPSDETPSFSIGDPASPQLERAARSRPTRPRSRPRRRWSSPTPASTATPCADVSLGLNVEDWTFTDETPWQSRSTPKRASGRCSAMWTATAATTWRPCSNATARQALTTCSPPASPRSRGTRTAPPSSSSAGCGSRIRSRRTAAVTSIADGVVTVDAETPATPTHTGVVPVRVGRRRRILRARRGRRDHGRRRRTRARAAPRRHETPTLDEHDGRRPPAGPDRRRAGVGSPTPACRVTVLTSTIRDARARVMRLGDSRNERSRSLRTSSCLSM